MYRGDRAVRPPGCHKGLYQESSNAEPAEVGGGKQRSHASVGGPVLHSMQEAPQVKQALRVFIHVYTHT